MPQNHGPWAHARRLQEQNKRAKIVALVSIAAIAVLWLFAASDDQTDFIEQQHEESR